MKYFVFIFMLMILGLLTANCGGKTEKSETKPTSAITNTQSGNSVAPTVQNSSNSQVKDNDGDADDVRPTGTNSSNQNKKPDVDDIQGKDTDDLRKPSNTSNKKGKERDDLNKKGDADDRNRRDDDDDN
ncbi:MAG: hypothetical protein K1X72_13955 [Pyrinomonadaceae bacterium]|nr:hypothetical protein [Pyrinomonadaceae bacterium]